MSVDAGIQPWLDCGDMATAPEAAKAILGRYDMEDMLMALTGPTAPPEKGADEPLSISEGKCSYMAVGVHEPESLESDQDAC